MTLLSATAANAETQIDCEDLATESKLLVEVCQCAEIDENDVQRLHCFDQATKRLVLQLILSKARAERLRRSPGGIEAMKRAIELGPAKQSE